MELRDDLLSEATAFARAAASSGADLAVIGDDDLLLFASRAEELGRLADALRVAAAGEIAERSRRELGDERLSVRRGCATPIELLERLTLVSSSTARMRVRVAAPLRSRTGLTGNVLPPAFPRVATAFSAGDIGVDAAAAIVSALSPIVDRIGADERTDAAEDELVASAYGTDALLPAGADELRIMAQTWALYLDPDGTLPDEERAMRERALTRGRARNGLVPWRGEFMPEVSAQLQALLDAHLNPKSPDVPGPRFSPPEAGLVGDEEEPRDRRTPAQRAHDALAGILHVAAGIPGMPSLGGAPPTLVVTTTATDLARPGGVAFICARDSDDTGAVTAAVARHIGCLGRVQNLMLGSDGQIIELGTTDRIFSGHRRRAIALRDGECIIPGCHTPAPWCEVHHVREYARGGPTHTDNGVLLCWWHHRTIETSGWEIRMVRGAPWVRAPRWIDIRGTWRPTPGSPVRRLAALAGVPPG